MLVNTPLDTIDATPSSTQERKAELLKILEAEKARFAEEKATRMMFNR